MAARHEILPIPRRAAVIPAVPTGTPPLSHEATATQVSASRAAGEVAKFRIQEGGDSGEVDVTLLEGAKLVALRNVGTAPTSVQVQASVQAQGWVDVGSPVTSFPNFVELSQPYRALRVTVTGFASPDPANYILVDVAGFNQSYGV